VIPPCHHLVPAKLRARGDMRRHKIVFLRLFKCEQYLPLSRAPRCFNIFRRVKYNLLSLQNSKPTVAIINNCALRCYLTYRFRKSKFKVQFNRTVIIVSRELNARWRLIRQNRLSLLLFGLCLDILW